MAQKWSQATRQQPPMAEQACTQWRQAWRAQCRITLGLQPVDRRLMLPIAAGVGGHWSSVADMEAEMGEAEMGQAEMGEAEMGRQKFDVGQLLDFVSPRSGAPAGREDAIVRLLLVENGDVV